MLEDGGGGGEGVESCNNLLQDKEHQNQTSADDPKRCCTTYFKPSHPNVHISASPSHPPQQQPVRSAASAD